MNSRYNINDKQANTRRLIIAPVFLLLIISESCKKFIKVDSPDTNISIQNVYENDATAASVLTGVYAQMARGFSPIDEAPGISIFAGLSADELKCFSTTDNTYFPFYTNNLSAENIGVSFWNKIYNYIYIANGAIEGLNKSQSLNPDINKQLLGEAHFIRAFSYFYLVNLYGGVPLGFNYKLQSQCDAFSISNRRCISTNYF